MNLLSSRSDSIANQCSSNRNKNLGFGLMRILYWRLIKKAKRRSGKQIRIDAA